MPEPISTLIVSPGTSTPQAVGPTWARMEQKHPAYDADLWMDCGLLYRGGFEIQKQAARFVKKAPQEPQQYYEWRLAGTSYLNHMGRVIGYLVGGIFGTPVSVAVAKKGDGEPPPLQDPEFYKAFAEDADLQSTDFSAVMQRATTDALVLKRALIGVDMPPGRPLPNRKESDDAGVGRAYVFPIALESMYDWELDDKEQFVWCKLHKIVIDRSDPFGDHTRYQHEFKIWRLVTTAAGTPVATFAVYRTKMLGKDDEMKPDDMVAEFTPPTATSFSRIPIVEMELPDAVWAGNQIGPLAKEHFQRRSDLAGAMCRNLVEIPYVKRGPEIPAVHGEVMSTTQMNPNRGADPVGEAQAKGYVAIGSADEIGFAGPSGNAYQIATASAAELRDEIFGAMNTMALALSNTGATVARSGLSKREDRSATAIVQDYLGTCVREAAAEVYEMLADGREEEIEWVASGADSYDDDDRGELVGEATEVEMLTIPSATFRRLYAVNLANALVPKGSDADKKLIAKELMANITEESVLPPPVIPLAPPGSLDNQPKPPPKPAPAGPAAVQK